MTRTEATVAGLLLAVIVMSVTASCVAGLPRPMSTKEKVYQAGGVLLGIGQELEAAIKAGLVKGEPANRLIIAYDTATQLYREAAALAIQGKDTDALTVYQKMLTATRTIIDGLTAAGVKL